MRDLAPGNDAPGGRDTTVVGPIVEQTGKVIHRPDYVFLRRRSVPGNAKAIDSDGVNAL
jgi:hypothetical protein